MREKWIVEAKKGDFNGLSAKLKVSPLAVRCLMNRGVESEQEMRSFLYGTLDDLHDPFTMKGMNEAVQEIVQAREQGRKVAIASDFDCDGIFSAYILWKGFQRIGLDSEIFTPDRVKEGYGLNRRIVDEALAGGRDFLVTCDNGIAANEEVDYAKKLGMTVIVTDHHEVQEQMPAADVVLDPKRDDETYPFHGLCGAGVAFKLICALYDVQQVPAEAKDELLEYAGIATVADVMELQGENRILVKYGLQALSHTKNTGLRALLEVQELSGKELEAYHIGFILGPCFNAAGRIDTVTRAFELLEETNKEKALQMARQLKDINDTRKQMTEEAAKCAFEILQESGKEDEPVHIVLLPDCHESLVGIVAGRIKEEYHHPVIVFCPVGDGLVKGSGRSIEEYSMYEELCKCRELLDKFGGHPMAAGLSLPEENVDKFRKKINACAELTEDDLIPKIKIDIPMPAAYADAGLIREFAVLEPFGKANIKPQFADKNLSITKAFVVGKNQNVLRLNLVTAAGEAVTAVYFGDIEAFKAYYAEKYGSAEVEKAFHGQINKLRIMIVYYPEINEYNGVESVQVIIRNYQ